MPKRIIIIHQWYGSPEKDWLPWAKQELKKRGFEITVPSMPDPDHPRIESWVRKLSEEVGNPDENTILIGHSVGGQTILRYLEKLPEGKKIDKVITVAGWFFLTPEATPEEEEKKVAELWLKTPIDFEKVKTHTIFFTAIFSDNDPYVPLEKNSKIFKEKLEAHIVILKKKGHFSEDDGVKQLPEILNTVV